MNENLSKNRVWMKAGRWLAVGMIFAVGGCCYSCRVNDSTVAAEETFAEESFQWEEASETQETEGTEHTVSGEKQTGYETEEAKEGTPESSGENCYVYICGQVMNPGVYQLEAGQRIFEAVELAGGFSEKARPEYLNLAEPVFDGMKIFVPDETQTSDVPWNGQPGGAATGQVSGGADSGEHVLKSKVNINSASKEELMTLTGIGESRAEDIIRYRREEGAFSRIEDIMKVPGIKEASFQKLKDQIEV